MTGAFLPVIPETITVHLGAPNSNAENVTVTFPDYIKNVASSEIFPTWSDAALRANIYAQISFALNRIYTEYYRSRGYDFDITNSTSIDQSFVNGRDVFENISQIVDEIFNSYIVRRGSVVPLFAAYCNGTTTTCNGLSQWGSQALAEEGLGAYDILTRYYGDDIDIVQDAPVAEISESLPPVLLEYGSSGNEVRLLQNRLNRISANYPSIPKIYPADAIFDTSTENAVREFQRIFNLTADGIVGKATWYRIIYIYNAVNRLNEVVGEAVTYDDVQKQFNDSLVVGDSGMGVEIIQYYLEVISNFNNEIPTIPVDSFYDEQTAEAVSAFQRAYGIPETGEVNLVTYDALYDAYIGIVNSLPESLFTDTARPYPGIVLRLGSESPDVSYLQEYLNTISEDYPEIPSVNVTGVFDDETNASVLAFQEYFGLPVNGLVNVATWERIASVYDDINGGRYRNYGQYPGYDIG